MAKQSINIIERHVEKGVLGLCGLILVGAIVMFLVSTPNTVDLRGEQVTPETIDNRVLDEARSLLTRMNGVKVEEAEIEPLVEQFVSAKSPIDYANLSPTTKPPAPWLPPVPEVKWTPVAGELRLADVIAVEDLQVTFGRSSIDPPLPQVLGKSNQDAVGVGTQDVNWVTVSARFDQVRQINAFQNAGYKVGKRNPYVIGVDLQRREKLASGAYSDWVDVITYRPLVPPAPPEIVIEQTRKGPLPTIRTQDTVREYFNLVREAQVHLIRPLMPPVLFGDDWAMPGYADLNVRDLDLELCPPDDECEPRDYGIADLQDATEPEEKSDKEIIAGLLRDARAAVDGRRWSEAKRLAGMARSNQAATQRDKTAAEQIIQDADQGKRDEDRGRLPEEAPVDDGDADEVDRPRSRFQVVWAHDATLPLNGGAESGKTYQYRMRVRLFNRYCAQPQDLDNADDAERMEVVGAWSVPSDDVFIPRDTVFFLTSGSPFSGISPKVTVFKWFEGVWTKHSMNVNVGDRIAGRSRHAVRVLQDGTPDRPEVAYDTNATVIDIIEDYTFPNKRQRGNTYEIQPAEPTIAMIYVDTRTGELSKRVLEVDKKSDAFKRYKSLVFEAPRR